MRFRPLVIGATLCAAIGLVAAAGPWASIEAASADAPEIGKPAPDFTLTDTDGTVHRLSDYTEQGRVVVLEWFNPDCPFVKKHHKSNRTMATTYSEFEKESLVWLAINSGGPGKQGHGHERNVGAREDYGIDYPVLLDEDGMVGRLYRAKTTPHMFVIAKDGALVYQGAIDDDRSTSKLGKNNLVKNALANVFKGKAVDVSSSHPYGCSVKYGPGSSTSGA